MNQDTESEHRDSVGALQGIRVLDLTRLLPGAFCSMLLADMGAEVTKIEQPGEGDYNRTFPPMYRGESGSFLLLNRNKKSVTLNLKSDAGRTIFLQMVREADVVLEGFRPGVMDRLNLSYETLAATNPRLVYCAISGFGQDGPMRLAPGHDLNYMALSGALQLFAKAGETPMVPGLSIADVGGGSFPAAVGILAALLSRANTDRGQFIDISMTDGTVAWLALHGADFMFAGVEPKGGERPFIGQAPCYNVYACQDSRAISLGIIEPHFWARFCNLVGLQDLIEQQWPQGEAAEEQRKILTELFLSRDRDAWVEQLLPADIPVAPVNSLEESIADPQLRHREMYFEMEHPTVGTIGQLGFPIKMSETPCTARSAPPAIGLHTDETLARFGYNAEEISHLRTTGVV